MSEQDVLSACLTSKNAAVQLRQLSSAIKNSAISHIADALVLRKDEILAANAIDCENAEAAGLEPAMLDRLRLSAARIEEIANSARAVIELADPVGQVMRSYELENGLRIQQVRVPLGVIAMIYEARPNVTVDAAVLCLKSGNAALLRGSSSAFTTNNLLVRVMREAIAESGITPDAINLVPDQSREAIDTLMKARGMVDVIIPRGGAGLINTVVANSVVPVIETGIGNCHMFIDATADLQKAVALVINAKTQRVSVCNALETVLVHSAISDKFWPMLMAAFADSGVVVHGSEDLRRYAAEYAVQFLPATEKDWADEYLSLDIAARTVQDIDEAIAHIQTWSSGHTEAIVSQDAAAIEKFVTSLDSAALMVNASTRFTDGGEFGFGAEIGISTQKLHARGPMGLSELTSWKYVVTGDGQTRK